MSLGEINIIIEVRGDKGMDETFRIGLIQETSKFPNLALCQMRLSDTCCLYAFVD